jgi:hypothetical protein
LALVFVPFALALVAGAGPACKEARDRYESLSLEEALLAADRELEKTASRPIACLEVKALSLIVLGRLDEARSVLEEIFSRDPDDALEDPSLSPAQRESIDAVRDSVRPLKASVRARWLVRESIRIDVLLEGGLRGARRARMTMETAPDAVPGSQAEVPLVGRVATATVAVPSSMDVARIRVAGSIVGASDKTLLDFSSELLLDKRPEPAEVLSESAVPSWLLWGGIGVAVIGAAVAIVLIAQPKLPDATMSLGRLNGDR